MKNYSSKRGSALLIVIGMLSFLIVSAVGFSAYMRYSRLPSSYLRRSASSRQLVKAGMAQAIDALDRAIGNNPHPGVGNNGNGNLNHWYHRVLIGEEFGGGVESLKNKYYNNTVSTLSLEALAYIPPPLINEARYFSRLTPTAMWKSFDFDIGRYAFSVLDVSDYFDINRLFANKHRSSAPNQRVSLSYIFEKGREHTAVGEGAQKWDDFMEQFREVDKETNEISFDGKYPLISLADFNLALGQQGKIGDMESPFCNYIKSGGGGDGFYNLGQNDNAARDAMLSRMTFVTDGLFPRTTSRTASSDTGDNDADEIYDLTDAENQPFDPQMISKPEVDPAGLSVAFSPRGKVRSLWGDNLSRVGYATLYDYLDVNRCPVSLAIPTVERVPMVCGVDIGIDNMSFAVKREFSKDEGVDEGAETRSDYKGVVTGDENTRTVKRTVFYRIDAEKFNEALRGKTLRALTVFPFARNDKNDGNFKVDGRFSFFFSSEKMNLRTEETPALPNDEDKLHLAKEIDNTEIDAETGMINIKLDFQDNIKTTGIKEEIDAVQKLDFRFDRVANELASALTADDYALLKVVYEWQQTYQKPQAGGPLNGMMIGGVWKPSLKDMIAQGVNADTVKEVKTAFPAFKKNGTLDEAFTGSLRETVLGGKQVQLNCAAWFRVKDDEGNVVDMVPACMEDDKIQNNAQIDQDTLVRKFRQESGDVAYPVLKFNTDLAFNFSIQEFERMQEENPEQQVTFTPRAAMVADPRYNHAPEEWFSVDGELSEQSWVDKNKSICRNSSGEIGRDRDIFMATSDAGYMQSVYELAFLPRLTDALDGKPRTLVGKLKNEFSTGASFADIAGTFEKTRSHELAWRTYDFFKTDVNALDKFPFTSEGIGYKVNPYSDSTNVLMAVFANTPLDWRCSSTNKLEEGESYVDMDLATFNKDYAFNAYATDSNKIKWSDLESVAGKFITKMRSCRDGDWERVWCEEMDWRDTSGGDGRTLCGIELQSNNLRIWDVDKKFLFGFWKDCFAVKQQLFLVFVRAEPMMMGSGAAGQMPPQLGGRAMALVWRDPTKTQDEVTPHRTRVLFYRQFE